MNKDFNYSSLSSKQDVELQSLLYDLKKSLFNFRFRHVAKELTNITQMKFARKNIAKVKTEINRRVKLGGVDA